MRKVSKFTWLVVSIQVVFVILVAAILQNRATCEEQEDVVAEIVSEVFCEGFEDLFVYAALGGLIVLWIIANVILGIFALVLRKRSSAPSSK